MRKNLCFVLCILCLTSGCHMARDRAHVGWHFSVVKPPSIDTDTPVLINYGSPAMNAHPVGTAAGPVVGGQFTQGTMQMGPTIPPPIDTRRLDIVHPPCPPLAPTTRLTYEDWCRINGQVPAKKKPCSE